MLHARVVSPQILLLVQYAGVEDERGIEWFIRNNPRSRAAIRFSGNDLLVAARTVIGQPIGQLKSPSAAAQASVARSFFLPDSVPLGALGYILGALEDDILRKMSYQLCKSGSMGLMA